jgi:hypothetical protein
MRVKKMPPKHKRKNIKEQNINQIKAGDYALIVTPENDIEFLMPLKNEIEINASVPKNAFALIALSNKISDQEWSDNFVNDFFSEYDLDKKK